MHNSTIQMVSFFFVCLTDQALLKTENLYFSFLIMWKIAFCLFLDRSSWLCGKPLWEHAVVSEGGFLDRRPASVWIQAWGKCSLNSDYMFWCRENTGILYNIGTYKHAVRHIGGTGFVLIESLFIFRKHISSFFFFFKFMMSCSSYVWIKKSQLGQAEPQLHLNLSVVLNLQIIADALNQLSPQRANLVLLSAANEGQCHLKERWFGTQYSVEGKTATET